MKYIPFRSCKMQKFALHPHQHEIQKFSNSFEVWNRWKPFWWESWPWSAVSMWRYDILRECIESLCHLLRVLTRRWNFSRKTWLVIRLILFLNQLTRIELIKKKIGFNVRLFTEHNIYNLSNNGQLYKIYYEISL